MPTEEERTQIQEKHAERPDLPLGTAEDFLYTLSSVSELEARLSLWKFEYAFQSSEEEIAESLMDLKGAIEQVRRERERDCNLKFSIVSQNNDNFYL